MEYKIKKKLNISFDDALENVKENLKKEGFGVLTEIDVKSTLKEKLGVDFISYKILGVCNPNFAYKALKSELEIGLLLPCNVVVYEQEDGVYVSLINPKVAMGFIESEVLDEISKEVESKFQKVIDNM